MPPCLPAEITDYIIGLVWPDKQGLCSCSLVCQDWLPASRHYLFFSIDVLPAAYDKLVEHLNQSSSMRACLPSVHTFCLEVLPSNKLSLDHLRKGQRFIPDFSGHLPNLRRAEFWMTYFSMKMHPRLHLALHNFRKLQELSLTYCHFDSFNSLRRMLSALPGLTSLTLRWLSWSSMSPAGFPLRPPHQARPTLQSLSLALHPSGPQGTPDPHSLIYWLISLPTPQRISLFMIEVQVEEGADPYYLGPLRYMNCLSSPSSVRHLMISPFEIEGLHPDLASLVNLEILELGLTGHIYPYTWPGSAVRWDILCLMLQGVRSPLRYLRLTAYGARTQYTVVGELDPALFVGMEGLDSVLEGKAFKDLTAVTFIAISQYISSPDEPFDDKSQCSEEPFREVVRLKLPRLYARGITTFSF